MHRRIRQTVALIAALCLQAQALAAVVLPCAHQSAPPVLSAVHTCHGVVIEAGAVRDSGELSDCEKCTLLMVLSVYDLPASKPASTRLGPLPVLVAAHHGHFYYYSPDTPHRPPIYGT